VSNTVRIAWLEGWDDLRPDARPESEPRVDSVDERVHASVQQLVIVGAEAFLAVRPVVRVLEREHRPGLQRALESHSPLARLRHDRERLVALGHLQHSGYDDVSRGWSWKWSQCSGWQRRGPY